MHSSACRVAGSGVGFRRFRGLGGLGGLGFRGLGRV